MGKVLQLSLLLNEKCLFFMILCLRAQLELLLLAQYKPQIKSGYWSTQSRQSARLFLQSSELGLPHPLTRSRACPPPLVQRGWDTLACERGGPNSNEGTYTVVMYFVLVHRWWHEYILFGYLFRTLYLNVSNCFFEDTECYGKNV